ncbi:phosphatidylinositol N-acetylglucosaminyltransferase subunit C isoform X3 [Syngnathoides biaculeatus]|uniref:phosphatidylinositol N-acetylglucosaminyltransferase subunit C isoform X3 n=1 Tax=Syngnathoides biaculeatus TaxID=300417 RepID=UPI002ADDEC48|nr:phosphatidylinositol N-acetylglucosaminyltransferase subunit C isoform X3 [Syngnathoides biaculeatus]
MATNVLLDTTITRAMGADDGPGAAVAWRKVLWERQPYPDNYVDRRFLEELRRNEGLRQYRYWAVVQEAGLVGEQLSCVAIFITLWLYMEEGLLSPETLLVISLASSLLGYGLYQALASQAQPVLQPRTRLADLQSAAIFLAFIFGFSPVLKTLTESVSTDTVYAMSAIMLLAHLVSFPYAYPSTPGCLSLNAALFASVCLASRLPGTLHTFTMLSCALMVFALWPCLLGQVKDRAPRYFAAVCAGVCAAGVGGLASRWPVGAAILALALVSVMLMCPWLLVRLQRHKDNIHGPWDEAEIREDLSRFLH